MKCPTPCPICGEIVELHLMKTVLIPQIDWDEEVLVCDECATEMGDSEP